jgi:hypothetical protein
MTELRLLDMTWDALRRKHYSLRTEESYLRWIHHSSCTEHHLDWPSSGAGTASGREISPAG